MTFLEKFITSALTFETKTGNIYGKTNMEWNDIS